MSQVLNFFEYEKEAAKTAVYPGSGELTGLMYTALGLAGEAGEFADQVKKVLRDDDGVPTEVRKDKLKKELGDVMWYMARCCAELGFSLEEVAYHNVKKLADRKERGVLQGDGGIR